MNDRQAEGPAPHCTVVIAARNAASTIGAQLEALAAQDAPFEWDVIVADNGSTDQTAAIAERFSEVLTVRVLAASDKPGPAYARNRGVAATDSAVVAFCDADDIVRPGWLASITEPLAHAHAAVGSLLPFHGVLPPTDPHAITPLRRPELWCETFPYGATANMAVKRREFERLGGFDESLRTGEDIDLCLRLWLDGQPVRESAATIWYRQRAGVRASWTQAVSYGAASPVLARRVGDAGRRSPSRWRGLRRWLWLGRHAIDFCRRERREYWVSVLGTCVGRLIGSVRARSIFL